MSHVEWRWLASILGLISAALFGAAPALAQEIAALDHLLQAGKTIELAAELRSGRYQGAEFENWLRRRAEEGHPLAQYEISFWLGKDKLREALQWHARGRLSRVLDAAECARSDNAGAVGWMLDLTYQRNETLARENEVTFSVAIDEALKWEATRTSRLSPKWICGESTPPSMDGDVLAPSRRAIVRRSALEKLAARARDIAAQQQLLVKPLNPDGFKTVTAPFIGAPLRWLDNERLYVRLATGIDSLPAEVKARMPLAQSVVWNVRTGEIEESKDLPRGNFCYYNGYVSYMRAEGDFVVFVEGPLGKQREVGRRRVREEGKPLPFHGDVRRPNRFSCRWAGPESTGNGIKYPLLEKHGYVLIEESGKKLTYFQTNTRQAVGLPFSDRDIRHAVYVQFLDTYVIPVDPLGPSSSQSLSLWFLSPEGVLRKEVIPAGFWSEPWYRFHVSRAGITLWSYARPGRPGDDLGGIHLHRANERARLLTGRYNGSDVSPDGCRIAAGLGHEDRGPELKVIDVCKGRD